MQNLYGQAKDAAREAGEAASNFAKDAYENSGETFQSGTQAVAKTVRDNPLGSLLIAGGIGFALAMMMRPSPPMMGMTPSRKSRRPTDSQR